MGLRGWEGMMAPGIDEEMNEDREVRTGHPGWGMMRSSINFDVFFKESCPGDPFPEVVDPNFEPWRNCQT